MINKIKQEKGITLVALVVTILIMTILVGVTLSVSVDDELVETTQSAAKQYEEARVFQALDTILVEARSLYENNFITEEQMWENIRSSIGQNKELAEIGTIKIEADSETDVTRLSVYIGERYTYTVRQENVEKGIESIERGVTARLVDSDPGTYYGKTVSNYKATNSSAVGWKIFHSDGTNIYLIADDYIPTSYLPAKNEKFPAIEGATYSAFFWGSRGTSNVLLDQYTGSDDISDERMKALNNDYFNMKKFTSTSDNMRAVAYMLDTNIWSGFKAKYANYAIGSPTLELFVASYNATHSNAIEVEASSANGYKVKWSTDADYQDSINGLPKHEPLYVITSTQKAGNGMWLATTGNVNGAHVYTIRANQYLKSYQYNNTGFGFRPVICLNSDVKLEEQSDGTYHIK